MKDKNKQITDLKSTMIPAYSKLFIEVANNLGNYNNSTGCYETPAVARDVTRITRDVCDLWIGECIQQDKPKDQEKCNNLLHLLNLAFPVMISKTVSESQTKINLEKGLPKLPSSSDIRKLRDYVINIRDDRYAKLVEKFDYKVWLEMGQATLISILIFNRKRPRELSRLKLLPYKNCKESLRESQPNYYNNLPEKSKEIADAYVRVLVRGKKNAKITPVLLDRDMVKCTDLFIEYRGSAGVSEENPYVFGLPDSADGFRWIEASPLLNKYSQSCGASIPALLRGTYLRKHVATVGIALNLTDGQVENLSKFMGHDKEIHMRIYRQPVGTQDILEVSQYLQKA